MESQEIQSSPTFDSACNETYAKVLTKGISHENDLSNNNPSNMSNLVVNKMTNGNENKSTVLPANTNCAIIEETNQNSHSMVSQSLSQTDSYDGTDDSIVSPDLSNSQVNVNSQGTDESFASSSETMEKPNQNDVNESPSSGENSESGEDSDVEEENDLDEMYPYALKWKFRARNSEMKLPDTVTVLETKHGSKVFLVGTAHFSLESQEDVAKTIKAVQPDIVMIELCKSRVNILSLDEDTILEESRNMNFQKVKSAIEQNGFLQGVLYLLLLSMSAHLTKQLGMAPGGEFRRAFTEAKLIPGCLVHLGDRPIHITLQRALAKLSFWQKLRIAWYMLRAKDPISKEEVERCKQKDLLEEMLAEMTGEFPELSRVFVSERDIYLTYSLQMSAAPMPSPHSPNNEAPTYVVGVVGIGHVPGIKENWGKVTEKDIPPILSIPEPTLSSKILRQTLRLSLIGLGIYGVYKLIPKSSSLKLLKMIPLPTFGS